jgi:hypothetical protein
VCVSGSLNVGSWTNATKAEKPRPTHAGRPTTNQAIRKTDVQVRPGPAGCAHPGHLRPYPLLKKNCASNKAANTWDALQSVNLKDESTAAAMLAMSKIDFL